MRWAILTVLAAGWLVASPAICAEPPKDAKTADAPVKFVDKRPYGEIMLPQRAKSADALEKRVAELERRLAELEARPEAPLSALELRLVGNWACDQDSGLIGLRFMADHACRLATADKDGRIRMTLGTYEVVGKAVKLNLRDANFQEIENDFVIVSIDTEKLVIRGRLTGGERQFRRQ